MVASMVGKWGETTADLLEKRKAEKKAAQMGAKKVAHSAAPMAELKVVKKAGQWAM